MQQLQFMWINIAVGKLIRVVRRRTLNCDYNFKSITKRWPSGKLFVQRQVVTLFFC